MKRAWWVVVVLAVAAPALFAQTDLKTQVARQAAQARMSQQQAVEQQQKIILKRIETVRRLVGNMKEYNASFVMQAVVELADTFFTYVPAQAGVPATAADFRAKEDMEMQALAYFIDQPMQAGWMSDGEEFVITRAIDTFLKEDAYQWGGEKEKRELAVFSQIIKKYSPWKKQENKEPAAKKNSREPVLPLSSHIKK